VKNNANWGSSGIFGIFSNRRLRRATMLCHPRPAADFLRLAVERRPDHRISTLRRHVTALGGEIEITAVVDGKRIRLAE